MKKRFLQYGLTVCGAALITGIPLFVWQTQNTSPASQSESPTTPTLSITDSVPQKRIVAILPKNKFVFYDNGQIANEFYLDEEIKKLGYLPSGEYTLGDFSNFNLDSQITDFGDSSTAFIVLNPNYGAQDNGFSSYFFKNTAPKSPAENLGGQAAQISSAIKSGGQSTPKVKAKAVLVKDIETGDVIYQKNKDEKFPIASLTKLTTTLVAYEKMDQHKNLTVSREALREGYGSSGNLRRGEQLTVKEILYPLLLSSSNDAAYVLAIDYGEEAFVKSMNEKAAEYGLASTTYAEPSGLDPKNISTAEDLFKLSQNIFKNNQWIFDTTKLTKINEWRNNNYFAGNKKYLGGKNGYIPEIKETSIAIFSLPLAENGNERKIAIILLGSSDREGETLAIIKWLQNEIGYNEIVSPKKAYSEKETAMLIKDSEEFSILLSENIFNKDNKNFAPTILKIKNSDVGFLNFSDFDKLSEQIFSLGIRNAVNQTDVLVVALSNKNSVKNAKTNSYQAAEKLAKLAIDNGAKIVIGDYNDTTKSTENYNNGLIHLSLGDFSINISDNQTGKQSLKVTLSQAGRIKNTEVLRQ